MDLKAHKDEKTGRWTLEGVEPSEKTFERMCKMLRNGENFKFARYGDGEFLCMSGKVGRNCDGHDYFPDLGQALNDAFYSDPNYMVGIQPLSVHSGLYQRALSYKPGPKNIYDADVLHSASIDGRLKLFFDAVVSRATFVIGPTHLFPFFRYGVAIPDKNCWLDYRELKNGLRRAMSGDSDTVILLCASMMSEVIIHDFRDYPVTIIDCGSVFDPYVGKLSRSYHYKKKQWTLN